MAHLLARCSSPGAAGRPVRLTRALSVIALLLVAGFGCKQRDFAVCGLGAGQAEYACAPGFWCQAPDAAAVAGVCRPLEDAGTGGSGGAGGGPVDAALMDATAAGCGAGPSCAGGQMCEADAGRCVNCLNDQQCTLPGLEVCLNGACVECTSDRTHCLDDNRPVCGPSNACGACTSDQQCRGRDMNKPACNGGSCVVCVPGGGHCPSATPVCEANACRTCATDAECVRESGSDPGLCLDNGQCATAAQVIYVQRSASCATTATAGTAAQPFCAPNDARVNLSTTRPILLLRGPEPLAGVLLDEVAHPVLIVGQGGARLSGSTDSSVPLIDARATDLSVRDLEIRGARGAPAAVQITGGTLRMTRCRVVENENIGVFVNEANFDITNTIIAANGRVTVQSGVRLGAAPATPARFVNNTVVDNGDRGVLCTQAHVLRNVLAFGNTEGAFSSMCNAADPSNDTSDPKFAAAPALPYHLSADSPCVDQGSSTGAPLVDIDGQPRSDGFNDCGADEYTP